jgi:Fic family protein
MKKILTEIDNLNNEIKKIRPLSKNELKQIKEYFRIGLTYSSNALEGNSLTESETKVVLEDGITIGGKPLKDHFEAVGHSNAFDFMYELSKKSIITEGNIKKIHKLFYLKIDDSNAGIYRKEKVIITGSKYNVPTPEEIPKLMTEFINKLPILKKSYHPVEFAAKLHKEFVFIHPFIDGNGRVGRLLMNLVLLQAGYPIAISPPILRSNYINLLEKAHKNEIHFIKFIAECVIETQKDYLRLLK